ncbi:hypothetical protein MRX96_028009 [Rhipicephalus microplus]
MHVMASTSQDGLGMSTVTNIEGPVTDHPNSYQHKFQFLIKAYFLPTQLFAVISTSSPDCVEPHAPGTPNGTCPPQPEPSRCWPEPLQPPVPVVPYAATKPTASTSSSHPENYKYSQPCTARLSGQWNGAAATMVSFNHFLLFVQKVLRHLGIFLSEAAVFLSEAASSSLKLPRTRVLKVL